MSRRRRKKEQTEEIKAEGSVGGIAFFITLFSLLFVSILNLRALPFLWDSTAYTNTIYFSIGIALGMWFSYVFIRGHANVFIHEFKHKLVSGLAGNRAKKLHIKKETGHFTYEYTRQTAKFNALIALAPYFLPLFTLPTFLLAAFAFKPEHIHQVLFVGVAFGADLLMNFRDVSPVQTDITNITGGYSVGVLFIIAMNLTLLTILFAWTFQDLFGIRALLAHGWEALVHIVWYYRSR